MAAVEAVDKVAGGYYLAFWMASTSRSSQGKGRRGRGHDCTLDLAVTIAFIYFTRAIVPVSASLTCRYYLQPLGDQDYGHGEQANSKLTLVNASVYKMPYSS